MKTLKSNPSFSSAWFGSTSPNVWRLTVAECLKIGIMRQIIKLSLCVVMMTCIVACDKKKNPVDPPPPPSDVNQFITDIPNLPEPAAPQEKLVSSTTDTFKQGEVEYKCTVKKISLTENFDEVVAFNPNADVLWPGALVQGKSLDTGVPALIPLSRSPITISIDLPVVDNRRTVTTPTFGTVASAINDLISKNGIKPITTPARISYFEKEAYSFEQSMLKIGVSAKWVTGSIKGNFEIDQTIGKQSILVRYVQPYYTIAYEPPSSPASAFDGAVTVDALKNFMGPNNPPAYISSVTYGRMLIFKLTSIHSSEKMKRALKLAVNLKLGGGGGQLDQETKKILSESETTVLVLGGSAGNGIKVITRNDILGFLESEPNVSQEAPGVPIAYTIKWLKDHYIAKQGFTTEYEIRECGVNLQTFEVTIESIYIRKLCEERNGKPPSEIYYRFSVLPYDKKDPKLEPIEHLCTQGTIDLYQGQTHNIAQSRIFSLPRASGSFFVLRGWIRDQNDGCDAAQFDLPSPHNDGQYGTYNSIMGRHDYLIENWRPGSYQYTFSDNNCIADVRFKVTLR